MKQNKNIVLIIISILIGILGGLGFYNVNKDKTEDEIINSAVNEIKNSIITYDMTEEDVKELPSTEIQVQTQEEEEKVSEEQEAEETEGNAQEEIRRMVIPTWSAAQIAETARSQGDAPDIVRDDVTKVTLFDYSDIIADEKPVYPQKQTSEE